MDFNDKILLIHLIYFLSLLQILPILFSISVYFRNDFSFLTKNRIVTFFIHLYHVHSGPHTLSLCFICFIIVQLIFFSYSSILLSDAVSAMILSFNEFNRMVFKTLEPLKLKKKVELQENEMWCKNMDFKFAISGCKLGFDFSYNWHNSFYISYNCSYKIVELTIYNTVSYQRKNANFSPFRSWLLLKFVLMHTQQTQNDSKTF